MGSVLSLQEFYELFKQYRRSARRLENRESYDVHLSESGSLASSPGNHVIPSTKR
jgi:hypothetical protein